VAGGNGGWDPQQRPQLRCSDGYCGYAGDATTMPMTDTARFPDALRPSWTNEGQSEGLGASTFLTGAPWGAWEGRLAVGFLAGRRVEVLHLDEAGLTTSHTWMDLPRQRARWYKTWTVTSTSPWTKVRSGASPHGRPNPREREKSISPACAGRRPERPLLARIVVAMLLSRYPQIARILLVNPKVPKICLAYAVMEDPGTRRIRSHTSDCNAWKEVDQQYPPVLCT
jgi:hypothetical protein